MGGKVFHSWRRIVDRGAWIRLFAVVGLLALSGCEKHYPDTDAGELQEEADLIDAMLATPCLTPEQRANMEEYKNLTYHHMELVRKHIAVMKIYLEAYEAIGCEEKPERH